MSEHASSNILDRLSVDRYFITLTFSRSIQIASINNNAFSLARSAATPEDISNPFKTIIVSDHYNSISRKLVLHFNFFPEMGDYVLTIFGLRDASGKLLNEEDFVVEYPFPHDPTPIVDTPPLIEVEDKSIKKKAFISSETIVAANPDFFITKTSPDNLEVFVEEDRNNGRISITFSARPSSVYLSKHYIKLQRKRLGQISRWETLDPQLSMDSTHPTIYVFVPSLDATPVYNTEGHTYFEPGYKYRVRLSSSISPQSL